MASIAADVVADDRPDPSRTYQVTVGDLSCPSIYALRCMEGARTRARSSLRWGKA